MYDYVRICAAMRTGELVQFGPTNCHVKCSNTFSGRIIGIRPETGTGQNGLINHWLINVSLNMSREKIEVYWKE